MGTTFLIITHFHIFPTITQELCSAIPNKRRKNKKKFRGDAEHVVFIERNIYGVSIDINYLQDFSIVHESLEYCFTSFRRNCLN